MDLKTDESGQTSVEYVLIVGGLIVVVLALLTGLKLYTTVMLNSMCATEDLVDLQSLTTTITGG